MKIFSVSNETPSKIPLFLDSCPCGFPSPAADFVEQELDLTLSTASNIQVPVITFVQKANQ